MSYILGIPGTAGNTSAVHAGLPHAAFLVALACAPCARAQGRTVADIVSVEPDTGACFRSTAIVEHVDRWLGPHATVPKAVEFITVRVGGDGKVSVEMGQVGKQPTHKTFDVLPSACTQKLRAVSLVIALAIDHTLLERVQTGAVAAAPPPPKAAETPSRGDSSNGETLRTPVTSTDSADPATPSATAGSSFSKRRVAVFGGAGMVVGALPSAVLGVSVGSQVYVRERFMARATAFATDSADVTIGAGTATTRLMAGRLDGCVARRWGKTGASVCVGLAGGAVSARGEQFDMSLTTYRPWVSTLLRAQVRLLADRSVGVQIGLDGFATLVRPRIHVMGSGGQELGSYTLPGFGGSLSVEVVLDFL